MGIWRGIVADLWTLKHCGHNTTCQNRPQSLVFVLFLGKALANNFVTLVVRGSASTLLTLGTKIGILEDTRNHMLRTSEVSFRFTKKASRGSEPKSLVGESVVPHHLTTKRSHKTVVLCLSNAAVVRGSKNQPKWSPEFHEHIRSLNAKYRRSGYVVRWPAS